jgi:Uma2 family endonuclease
MLTLPIAAPGWLADFIPPLENGECVSRGEFLRRYEASPDVKQAELIEGVIHMPSPVRIDLHAEPDGLIHGWLFNYAIRHGLKFYPNGTLLLDSENSLQPDAMLCSKPDPKGRVQLSEKGYLCGSPELVVEVAASSSSIDLQKKLRVYRRNGIAEYIVWRTRDQAVDWFILRGDEYVNQGSPTATILSSEIFPGLHLDVPALLAMDGAKLVAALA